MYSHENTVRRMPDIASQARPQPQRALDWVGMDGIKMPVHFDPGDNTPQRVNASISAFVNLKEGRKRGIHMSRLYLLIDHHLGSQLLGTDSLCALLQAFLASQGDLSDYARLCVRFDMLVRCHALDSDHSGWRNYPVAAHACLGPDGFDLTWETGVIYSSTCPASAALSRQLIQEQFARDFRADTALDHGRIHAWLGSEQGIVATPHAQRSVATLQLRLADNASFNLLHLIDSVERVLGTAVQTIAKREDEQAFAWANGRNPMFCEDAARRIQDALDASASLADFQVCVEHQESLHAHNVLAYASKGIPGGFGRQEA